MANNTRKVKGIRQRTDGRIEWRFTYNKQSYSGYASSVREAKEHMDNMRHAVKNGEYSKETDLTLNAWFAKWMELYRVPTCKDSTVQFYNDTFKRYISPEFGNKKIKALTTEDIQRFINRMARDYSKAIASAANFLLFDCLRQAAKLKKINANPMDNTEVPKFKKREKKGALSKKDEDLFLDYSQGSSYYPIFRMATLTGMRIGEILGLTWDNVDFEAGKLYIRQTLCYTVTRGQYLDTPKSEASRRSFPMDEAKPWGKKMQELLKRRRIEQNKQRLKMGEYWRPVPGMENLVFTTKTGTPHSDSNIRTVMRGIIKQMREEGHDIEDFTPHTLRHCFATRCIEANMNPKTLQVLLGHSTNQITMDEYCDVKEETVETELNKVWAVL